MCRGCAAKELLRRLCRKCIQEEAAKQEAMRALSERVRAIITASAKKRGSPHSREMNIFGNHGGSVRVPQAQFEASALSPWESQVDLKRMREGHLREPDWPQW